jgi:MFS family permease
MTEVDQLFRLKFVAVSVGNILEYFDYSVFASFLDTIGAQFFPEVNELMSLLQGAAIFGVAFVMRPLGGLIFGAIGDRYSRELALSLSVLLMLLTSLALCFLPTYKEWGLTSTVLLIVIRLCQGIACGGEYVGTMIYTIEGAPKWHGFWGGACKATAVFGNALGLGTAALIRNLLSEEDVELYGWRIPFLMAVLLGLFGWSVRQKLLETLEEQRRARPLMEIHGADTGTSNGYRTPARALIEVAPDSSTTTPAAVANTTTIIRLPTAPPIAWVSVPTAEHDDEEEDGIIDAKALPAASSTTTTTNAVTPSVPCCAAVTITYVEILVCIGMVSFWCLAYYTIFVWQLYFLTTEELIGEEAVMDKRSAWILVFTSNLAMPLLLPVAGLLGDLLQARQAARSVSSETYNTLLFRVSGCASVMKLACILMLVFSVGAYQCMITPDVADDADGDADGAIFEQGLPVNMIIGQSILVLPTALFGGCMAQVMVEMFPASVRYTGVGIAYNVANALVAGTSALVNSYLVLSDNIPTSRGWLLDDSNLLASPLQALFVDHRLHAAAYLQVMSVVAFLSLHYGLRACNTTAKERALLPTSSSSRGQDQQHQRGGGAGGRTTNVYVHIEG